MVEDVMAGVCDEMLFCGIFWSESGMIMVGVGGLSSTYMCVCTGRTVVVSTYVWM